MEFPMSSRAVAGNDDVELAPVKMTTLHGGAGNDTLGSKACNSWSGLK